MNDLLLDDKERLWHFLKQRKFVRTSEIIRWGSNNGSNRADRNARDFAERGLMRRLTEDEVERLYGRIGEGVYEVKA